MLAEAELVVYKITVAFDAIGISYVIGGSVASMVHGMPRLTADIDLVADIALEQVELLVAAVSNEFYIDADMVIAALQNTSEDGGSFNIVHLPTMVKVDVFARQATPFYESEWQRRERRQLKSGSDRPLVFVASAEDMILQKLKWYRLTGERSERQWLDVQGMLKIQGERLDKSYLRHWARELNISDLLTQAASDAGLPGLE